MRTKNQPRRMAVAAPSQKAPRSDATSRRRFRPGTQALRQIRKYQRSTQNVIARAPFQRVVREITQNIKPDARFRAGALAALQEATEAFLAEVMRDSQLCALHAHRTTLQPKDMQLALRLRGFCMPHTRSSLDD